MLCANAVSFLTFLHNFETYLVLRLPTFADDDDTCIDATAPCNCYSKLRLPLQDKLRITDKNKLPVTGFDYGPFTSQSAQAAIRFKSLECFNPPNIPTVTKYNCEQVGDAVVFTILSSRRVQFSIKYDKSLEDCYVEITFDLKVEDLKLTISELEVSTMLITESR